ncbi:AAA family ATPase [Chloroflexota bacterium]
MSAREVMEASTLGITSLWRPFLYEQSIAVLNSVAGVGKTTLCYNIAAHGAEGTSLAQIPFSRAISVLYADLETSHGLRASKLKLISDDNPPDNLYFIPDLDFIENYNELKEIVIAKSIDLLIVDTINEAFNTRDEQDNAEANRQFAYVKTLRDETNCSILLLAHSGKGEQAHKAYSTRGASARGALVDVVLNLKDVTEDEICLSKDKDRIGGGKEKLYLKKAGEDTFEVIEHEDAMETSLLIRAERFVLQNIEDGISQTKEFVEKGFSEGYSKPTIERALTNLFHARKINRLKKGLYTKIQGLEEKNE